MNISEESPGLRLLNNHEYEAVSAIELELSKYEPLDDSDPQNFNRSGIRSEGGKSIATAKRHVSDEIARAIKSYHLRVARNERRSKSFLSVVRHTIALSLCIVPIIIFSVGRIPERCKICLDDVELTTYFVISALCGGFGAALLGHDFAEYFLARFLGGAVGSLGALFTILMILEAIPPVNVLHVAFLSIGVLGAMPGLLLYFLVKIVSDECWVSDQQDFEDDFSSLTKLITEKA